MNKKFLIGLQYWEGDKERILSLLDLYYKTIQPNNPWADLCIYARFDATFPDEEVLIKMRHIFNKVWTFKSRTQMTGWPDGCNALWADLIMDAYKKSHYGTGDDPVWAEYKSILTVESDTCPLQKNWMEVLSNEWDSHNVKVMGAWDNRNGDHPHIEGIGHINGNAMFAMDLAKVAPACLGSPYGHGWDTVHAPLFKKIGWQGTYAMRNWYEIKTVSKKQFDELVKENAVFLHGIKDDSVRNHYIQSL
jgi:hypothetical protein